MKYYKYIDDSNENLPVLIYRVKDENQKFEYFTEMDGWLPAYKTWKNYIGWMKNCPDTEHIKLREITEQEAFIDVI